MKILLVSQYFWPETFPINDVARGLNDAGHEVTVLTSVPNYPSGKTFPGYGLLKRRRERYHGIDVIRVPVVPRGKGGFLRLVLNYISYVVSACLLAPFCCRSEYDIIFVYEPSPITVGLPAQFIKKLKGAPIMFWVQDLWPESLTATGAVKSRSIMWLVEKLVRFIYRGCDRILVQSEAFRGSIENLGVEPEKIEYVPNSAASFYEPLDLESNASERAELPSGMRVMFAGNVGAAQDFESMLNAAERLRTYKGIHWVIIGDGRQYPWVKDQIESRELRATVHLLGRRPAEQMPRYFACASALLVSLKKDPIFASTIPAKVQSYLACGRPIIAALDGEGARVIEDACAGLTCPSERPDMLADRVLKLYQMQDGERDIMGSHGREYYEKYFERGVLLDRLERIMCDLTAKTKPINAEVLGGDTQDRTARAGETR